MATLFALPVCQSLKNKLHTRKTNIHSKQGDQAADKAERISRPANNGRERSLTTVGTKLAVKPVGRRKVEPSPRTQQLK